ncbi:MAG: tRNA dihydrouridine synthase DusB [Pseudomonadales bacterium]
MPITLGKHTLQSSFALAPMAGLTDVPFRTLAWRYGAGHMVSEMVSSKPELWDTGKSSKRRVPVPGVEPNAVQLAGTDAYSLAEAARRHVDEGVQVIDLNFGCPAKKVCKKYAGSALLGDLKLLAEIVSSVVAAVPVPVTVKTRTGLIPGDGLGLQAARLAQDAGAQMVVMHARSRACRFNGRVDYQAVAQVKHVLDIPLLVNGDIADVPSARRALRLTGADGVMVGRAAVGQPWVFAQLTGQRVPSQAEKWQTIHEHVSLMHEFYGEHTGVRIARKHIAAYAQSMQFAERGVQLAELHKLAGAAQQLRWLGQAEQQYNASPLSAVA